MIKILLVIALLFIFLVPSAQAQDITLFEEYNAGDNGNYTLSAMIMGAQTFQASGTYTLDMIRLKLWKQGSPGLVNVSLQRLDDVGEPNGVSLSTGSINADLEITPQANGTWYSIDMTEYEIQYNINYAIVVSASTGDVEGNNTVEWRFAEATGTHPNSEKFTSDDGGITWAVQAADDYMFEVWGETNLAIHSVKVWQNYKEVGDWLITVYYTAKVNPFYDDNDAVERWFNLQLLVGNCTTGTVVAQSPIRYWGDMVGSIYLNADEQSSLEWQNGNYSVKLYSTITETCYTLELIDWRGVNLNELDTWAIEIATDIGDREDEEYVVNIAGQGLVINDALGGKFQVGIPDIESVRGTSLFQSASRENQKPTPTFENNMQAESDMEARLGGYVYGSMEEVADEIGLDVGMFGFMGIALIYIMMAARGLPIGHTGVGILLSTGFLFLGLYTGTFQWVWFALVGLIASALFIWHTFLRQT